MTRTRTERSLCRKPVIAHKKEESKEAPVQGAGMKKFIWKINMETLVWKALNGAFVKAAGDGARRTGAAA